MCGFGILARRCSEPGSEEAMDLAGLAAYRTYLSEIAKLNSALALLQWDQTTYLPPKARASRIRAIHER